jgi:hypothetical protein
MRRVGVTAILALSGACFGCYASSGDHDDGGGRPDVTSDDVECETTWAVDFPCSGDGYCEGPTRIRRCVTRWWGPEYGTPCYRGASCEWADAYDCPDGTVCFDRRSVSGISFVEGCEAWCLPPRDAGADVDYDAWPGCSLHRCQ